MKAAEEKPSPRTLAATFPRGQTRLGAMQLRRELEAKLPDTPRSLEAAVPQCDGDFGGVVGAVLMHAEGAKIFKIWSPLEGVAVTNRAGSASVTGSVRWDARGLGNRNLTLSVCAAERNWSVVINRLGRPRLSEAWGVCSNVVGA